MIGGDDIQILKRIVAELGYKYVCHNPQAFASAILDICDVSDVKQLTNTLRSPYSAKLMAFFLDGRSESATWAQQKTFLIDESGMSTENAETVLNVLWQVMGWQRQQPSRQALIHSEEAMPKVDPKFKKEYVSMDRRDTTPGTDPPKVDAKFRKEYAGMSGSYHKAEDAPPKTNTEAQSHSCNAGGQPPHIDQPQNASLHNTADEGLTCPWCRGSGHLNVVRYFGKSKKRTHWISEEICSYCDGTGILSEDNAPEILEEFNSIKKTAEYRNADRKCLCCGGIGFVNSEIVSYEEADPELLLCPLCYPNEVIISNETTIRNEVTSQIKRKMHLLAFNMFFWLLGCLVFAHYATEYGQSVDVVNMVIVLLFSLGVIPMLLALLSAWNNPMINHKAALRTWFRSSVIVIIGILLMSFMMDKVLTNAQDYSSRNTQEQDTLSPDMAYSANGLPHFANPVDKSTAEQITEVWLPEGKWNYDFGDTSLQIKRDTGNRYSIEIYHCYEYNSEDGYGYVADNYLMTGQYDSKLGILEYSDGHLISGWEDSHTVYTNGKGIFKYEDDILYWNNYESESDEYIEFVLPGKNLPQGYWVADNGVTSINIDRTGENIYAIDIHWGGSWYYSAWYMTGQYDSNIGILAYSDCVLNEISYDAVTDIQETKKKYENGTGKIQYKDGIIYWNDDQENIGEGIRFICYENDDYG